MKLLEHSVNLVIFVGCLVAFRLWGWTGLGVWAIAISLAAFISGFLSGFLISMIRNTQPESQAQP